MSYQPDGVEFYDRASGREMLLIDSLAIGCHNGWLCFKHPDGQWVTQRLATSDDRYRISEELRRVGRIEAALRVFPDDTKRTAPLEPTMLEEGDTPEADNSSCALPSVRIIATPNSAELFINGEKVPGVRKYHIEHESGVDMPVLVLSLLSADIEIVYPEVILRALQDSKHAESHTPPLETVLHRQDALAGMVSERVDINRLAERYTRIRRPERMQMLRSLGLITHDECVCATRTDSDALALILDGELILRATRAVGMLQKLDHAVYGTLKEQIRRDEEGNRVLCLHRINTAQPMTCPACAMMTGADIERLQRETGPESKTVPTDAEGAE